jgi:hypothetical protein
MKKWLLLLLLIPKLAWGVVASDNFNRTENPLASGWLSETDITNTALQATGSTVEIVTAGSGNVGCYYYNSISPGADQFSEIQIPVMNNNGFDEVVAIVRTVTTSGGTYLARLEINSGTPYEEDIFSYDTTNGYKFYVTNGSPAAWVAGDTLRLTVSGSVTPILNMYRISGGVATLVNTYTIVPATDAVLTSGKPGFCLGVDTDVTNTQVDNWRGGDGDGTITPVVAVRHHPILQ